MKNNHIKTFIKITTLVIGVFLSNESQSATQTLSVNGNGIVVNTNVTISVTNALNLTNINNNIAGIGNGLTGLNPANLSSNIPATLLGNIAIAVPNIVTNGRQSQYWGTYSTITLAGFATNQFDFINAFQHPQAGGHYVFSKLYGCYTNSANTNNLFYFNNSFFGWEFGTNSGDSDGSHAYYSDGGSTPNRLPTNSTTIWYEGNLSLGTIQALPACVAIGNLATSNNPTFYVAPSGQYIVNLDNNNNPYVVHSNIDGTLLYDEYVEFSTRAFDTRATYYGGPLAQWTNDNNAAHSFAPGTTAFRLNGAIAGFPDVDNRVYVELGTGFGRVVLNPDGTYNKTNILDKGGAAEFLVRKDNTNSTVNGTGKFAEPLRLNGDASVWLGDVPTGFQGGGNIIHGTYVYSPAALVVFNTTTSRPAMIIPGQTFIGANTNGGFWNDSVFTHLMQSGRDGIPLTGTDSSWNGGSLTNCAQNIITFTNFLFGSLFTNTSTRNELVNINARCNPTTTGNAIFALVTSTTGTIYTTNGQAGMEADVIFTTAPHSWYQLTAQIRPGGIWKVVDVTGEGLITITNSFYQTLQ